MESASPAVHRGSAGVMIVLRPLVYALGGAITLVTLYLIARRLSGALVLPLEFLPALSIGLLFSLGTWLLRRLALAILPERPELLIGICAVTWLLVVGLTLSGTMPLVALALWLPVIATEAYWRAVPPDADRRANLGSEQAGTRVELETPVHEVASPGAEIVQQLVRTRVADCERIRGTARIEFAAGEQTAAQHVVFSPPLENDPEVEVDVADGDGITVRATDCRTYGLRLEARRGRDSSDPLTIRVSFEAVST